MTTGRMHAFSGAQIANGSTSTHASWLVGDLPTPPKLVLLLPTPLSRRGRSVWTVRRGYARGSEMYYPMTDKYDPYGGRLQGQRSAHPATCQSVTWSLSHRVVDLRRLLDGSKRQPLALP
jgi:hypothetical protein